MNPEMFLTTCLIFALCTTGSVIGAYFFGFSRGNRERLSTPVEEPVNLEAEMHDRGYLGLDTSPVIQVAGLTSVEIIAVPAREHEEELELIACLTAKLAKAERLRRRYLRLLRQERAMAMAFFTKQPIPLSPYWKRWVNARMRIINEFDFGRSSSILEIANRA